MVKIRIHGFHQWRNSSKFFKSQWKIMWRSLCVTSEEKRIQWATKNEQLILKKDWCAFSYNLLWEFDPTVEVPKPEDESESSDELDSQIDSAIISLESESLKEDSESLINGIGIDSSMVSLESVLLREEEFKTEGIGSVEKEVVSMIYIQGSKIDFPFNARELFDQMFQKELGFGMRFNEDLTGDWVRVEVANELVDPLYEICRVRNRQISAYKGVVCSLSGQWNYPYQLFDEMLLRDVCSCFKVWLIDVAYMRLLIDGDGLTHLNSLADSGDPAHVAQFQHYTLHIVTCGDMFKSTNYLSTSKQGNPAYILGDGSLDDFVARVDVPIAWAFYVVNGNFLELLFGDCSSTT